MDTHHSNRLRALAGVLAIAAVTPVLLVPFSLPAAFRISAELLVTGFIIRASIASFRAVWVLGIAAFGLLTLGAISNELHGNPPFILHVMIAWWGISFVLSTAGLYLDTPERIARYGRAAVA